MTNLPTTPLIIAVLALSVGSVAPLDAAQDVPTPKDQADQTVTEPKSTVEVAQTFSIGILSAPVTLPGDRFTGIVELGTGADGADGNDAGILEGIFFNAGDGGNGATGGHLTTTVGFGPFSIFTVGQVGIRSSSTGGDGGNGGHNNTIFEAGGGDGGRGGSGGSVVVTTTSTTGGIVTVGNGAAGILANSRGGTGGDGGDGSALFVGIGGNGDYGGNGGTVTVDANNAINTAGSSAHGIIGQSFGGNGGHGGDGTGLVSGGGDGSGSGNAGRVDITSGGNIVTTGARAFGIFSQSVGGFSGSGGAGIGYVTFGGGATSGGNGAVATITNNGSVTTHGQGSHALFAQSVGGNGGASGLGVGVVAIGGSGSDGGRASTARIDNTGTLVTTGLGARGIYAQSVGGGGGDGGVSVGVVAFGGRGAAGGHGGQVVVTNTGVLLTSSDAIFAQSVGGGGGSGGGTVGTTFSMGGTGSAGGNGASVGVTNDGHIITTLAGARGIFAQSVGGGGGDGSFSGGLVAIGGRGGTASHGGAVSVVNNGLIASRSHAIFAQSVGGGGGSGGLSGGWFSFGGTAGAGGNASTVNVQNTGELGTAEADSSALVAQSIGGGGGSGGGSISVGAFISVGVGGSGGDGGDGQQVDVTSTAPLIATLGARSHGVFAQSIGGGGGNGGFAASASIGYIVSASFGKGGVGADGGTGGIVNATIGGNITTLGSDATGVFAQSVGGGGGSGGWTISATGSDTVSVGLGFGGVGGGGGTASAVLLETSGGNIATAGVRSHGLFAQSVGGGGGSGGFSIAGGFSGVGAGALSMGGSGGAGGAGAAVTVNNLHAITTAGDDAFGLFAQSVGGGGGAAGFSIAAGGSGTAAGGIALGASGGSGGNSGIVNVTSEGTLNTFGESAVGIFAQSVGGGGGRGGFSASGAGAGTAAVSFNLGGSGGGGGDAEAVIVDSSSAITTRGLEAHGLFAQSLGGGGGNGGFSLTGSGAGTGAASVGVGGKGGDGGIGRSVDVTSRALVETWGESAIGLFAQSIGGGGGTGGFSLSGSGAGTGAGTFNLGGAGGGGGASDRVAVVSEGGIITHAAKAVGLFAQSVGGGGGNGGFSVTGTGAGTFSAGIGVGGFGGDGGVSQRVDVINTGLIETWGISATGLFAQSIGGGGGTGGFSISGSGAGTGSGSFSLGGAGGGGGNSDQVAVVNQAAIITHADDAVGLFAQSVGGGGGNGGFSLTGSGAGTGSGTIGIGGFGGDGGTSGIVDVTNRGLIETTGAGSIGIFAQSVGGGGGSGRFSISGSGAGTGSGSFSLGGAGGGGGNADRVWAVSEGAIVTRGDDATGLFAQSVGGGGGNGGFSITGSGAGTGSGSVGIGGFGGDGGNGSAVDVTTIGSITTIGDGAVGLLAQSIGGGGGNGRFSIVGSGAKSGSGTFSLGGAGGLGGVGDAVTVNNGAAITTTGSLSYGIFTQSVGGGGGSGGFSFSGGVTTTGGQLNSSVGGFGGGGGDAGAVALFNSAPVTTAGGGTHAVLVQSLGGGGGAGGFSGSISASGGAKPNVAVTIGGWGGVGGNGAAVTLDNLASNTVVTQGFAASGLFAQSVGGGGGDGGGSLSVAFGVQPGNSNLAVGIGGALGGAGGAAGSGGIVDVDNGAAITTLQARSHGIFAQSIGGGGGTGGFSATGVAGRGSAAKDLSVSIGGAGGAGGAGGVVDVENSGAVAVRGGSASGIYAQSVGGGGGDGGFSFAGSFGVGGVKDGAVTVGGSGGDGNIGGAVKVVNHGAIDIAADMTPEVVRAAVAALPIPLTPDQEAALVDALYTAKPAPGIVAQSIGGGGGNGGDSFALDLGSLGAKKTWDISAAVSVGGAGGNGNAGGRVDVTNYAAVTTRDDDSDGLSLQSIGGGGGRGGSSRTAGATLAATDGHSLRANVAVGGAGGDGNIAGEVVAINSGSILTLGDMSAGIRAQSIGGGGGLGGSAGGATFTFDVSFLNEADPGDEISLQVSVGGSGGTGNNGGAVRIDNSGGIVTRGSVSHGLFAQSIGAGGGSGGDSLDGLGIKGEKVLDLADKATGFLSSRKDPIATKVKDKLKDIVSEWNFAIGGNAGSSGDGAAVRVDNTASVTTLGYGSNAIFAQSIGGGGGEGVGTVSGETAGGKAEAGALGKVGIGGAGGAAGDGGAVNVVTSGLLSTSGDSAYGILAQSIGGGGGVAGNVERALADETTIPIVGVTIPALNIGLGVDFGRDGGGAGDGGVVTVNSTGDIVTTGDAATGILAQSVGGGGGLAGGIGLLSQAASQVGPYNFAGSVGGDGSGGAVMVTQVGTISTAGTAADGIFAQSAGGKDLGGNVTIDLTGSIFATGAGSNGILAQSRGDLGAGNITIMLRDGTVAGGAGGAAISLVEGVTNLVENFGAITTTQGVAGMAVLGTTGDESVRNAGTLIGSIDLGAGTNALTNMSGARFDAGAAIDLGAGNLFTNSGLFSPGGAGIFQTTTLTGNLAQAGAPTWLVDLGEIGVSDSLTVVGSSLGSDVTTLDLNLLAVPAGTGAYTLLSADGGLTGRGFAFGTLFGSMPIGKTFDFSGTNTTSQLTLLPSTGAFYWDGASGNVWNAPFVGGQSNWTRAGAGDFIFGTPGAASDVIFMPTGSVTALGSHFAVNSLTFAGAATPSTNATGIAAGHTLTLGGNRGITVESNSPGANIAVDLVLGADQVWTNGSELAVSGATITGSGRALTIAGPGITTIDAAIETGSGSLTKEGDGTLVLTGANRYSGGTTVSGGVLVGTTTSVQGNILNDAVVAFDQLSDGHYSGAMSGDGSLFKLNSGVLTLSGANSYSGGTWVAEGTLAGNTQSLQGTIQNDATVIFDQTAPGTYAGSIIGTGVLNKLGAGTLTLTGNSRTFAGETILGAGSLVVDGWLGGNSLLAQSGTLLGGSGILPSTTILGGATLAPGNSIGTLGVIGNVRFGSGSTYSVETNPDGSSDITVATGSLTVDGGVVNVIAGGSDYAPITRYPIFSATAGIGGTFSGVTANLPFLTPTLDYDTNLLLLTLRRNDIDFSIETPNGSARQVARVLNELVPSATGAMADVVNHLYALSGDDSLRSIRSLGGGIHQQVATATLGGVRTFNDINLSRLGRSAPTAAAGDEPAARQSYRRSASATARVTDWLGTERGSGWWVRGLAGDSRLPGEGSDPGATVPTRGVVIGLDRAVTPRLALGVSGARTDPEVRQEGSFDHTTSRMLHAGLYGTYRFGASRMSAAVGVGNQRYRTRREIFAGDDSSFAAADYDGRSYSGQVEFRHGVRLGGGVSLEAELGLQAAALTLDGVNEEGAGVVGLMLPHRRIESQRSLLGGTIYKSFGDGPRPRLTLEGRAAWAHEFDARAAMATRFLGDTQTSGFQIAPAGQLRDSALLGASVYSGVWERVRLFADITSEVGGPVRTIAGSVGVGWKW